MKLNGDKLKDLRDAKLLKQADAAREIGISVSALSAAEGGIDVWQSTAEAICAYYKVEPSEIVIPRIKENVDA